MSSLVVVFFSPSKGGLSRAVLPRVLCGCVTDGVPDARHLPRRTERDAHRLFGIEPPREPLH